MNSKLIFIAACLAMGASFLLHSNILFIAATICLAFAIIKGKKSITKAGT